MFHENLGVVLDGNAVVATYDQKDVPVGCHLDADKTYFIEVLGRQQKILAKGDESLLLLLVSRFKLDTLEKAIIYEKKVDIRLLPLFRREGVYGEGAAEN